MPSLCSSFSRTVEQSFLFCSIPGYVDHSQHEDDFFCILEGNNHNRTSCHTGLSVYTIFENEIH